MRSSLDNNCFRSVLPKNVLDPINQGFADSIRGTRSHKAESRVFSIPVFPIPLLPPNYMVYVPIHVLH
jgi:hypothetical protein